MGRKGASAAASRDAQALRARAAHFHAAERAPVLARARVGRMLRKFARLLHNGPHAGTLALQPGPQLSPVRGLVPVLLSVPLRAPTRPAEFKLAHGPAMRAACSPWR